MTLIIGIEIIQLLVITNVIGVSKMTYYTNFAGSFYANITTSTLLIVITLISKHILRKLVNAKLESNIKIIVFSTLTFLCSTMFLYTIVKEFKMSDDILLYLISIIVLLIVLFS